MSEEKCDKLQLIADITNAFLFSSHFSIWNECIVQCVLTVNANREPITITINTKTVRLFVLVSCRRPIYYLFIQIEIHSRSMPVPNAHVP